MQNDYQKNQGESVQTLAKQVLGMVSQGTRDNGDTFKMLNENAPEWMQDLVQDAHAGSLPDDHSYEFIFEALNAIVDADDEDSARESIEGDTYNRDLLTWLSSSLNRAAYVDQAVNDQYIDVSSGFNVFDTMRTGQWIEKLEVFDSVLESLQNRLDEVEAA